MKKRQTSNAKMDPASEQNKPLAREIVRLLLDAWRLKRAYKYRSEKRVTHRKLYLSLMNQLMHEIGHRSLHDIIMQRIHFFNHNFKTSLTLDQFQDLLSQNEKCKEPHSTVNTVKEESESEQGSDASVIDVVINKDTARNIQTGNQNQYEVKSTDALRSLCAYEYDPELDNEEILSNIKEIEREDDENVDETNIFVGRNIEMEHELASHGEIREFEGKEDSIHKSDVRQLKLKLQGNEELRMKIEPLLVYKDDPDMYDRIIAPEIRGKKFKISNDGHCPRCHYKRNVFVILDFQFPMGDMPEICNYLIAKGQAVLWSSQDDSHCKDPPTMLCRGRCHTDPAKCGFNLNWNKTDLESIFFFPNEESPNGPSSLKTEPTKDGGLQSKNDRSDAKSLAEIENTSKSEQDLSQGKLEDVKAVETFDAGHIDMKHYKSNISWVVLDDYVGEGSKDVKMEDELIKTMLALSSAKEDWDKGVAKMWSDDDSDKETEEEEDAAIGCTDPPNDHSLEASSLKTTNVQLSNMPYAFSWDSYGSNPWAPVEPSKKKSQSSEPKLMMIATGKAHVPTLLNPTQAQKSEGQNEAGRDEEALSDETIVNADSADKCAITSTTLQAKDSSFAPASPLKYEGKAVMEGGGCPESKQKPYTADDYPVSKDGTCPHCKSTDVVYIIIDYKKEASEDNKKDEDLPDILKRLLHYQLAYKMPKDENEPPSFQCLSCTYGFNLDWSSTDLETIYGQKLEQAKKNLDNDYRSDHSAAASAIHEASMAYSAPDHAHQMPGGAGHPAFYFASPFMGYYPAMSITAMPYPSFYQPQFMPGYFPPPHGYPSYMGHPSGMPCTTPDIRNFKARGSHWGRGRGSVRDRTRGATEASLDLETVSTRNKSGDSLSKDASISQSNFQGIDNQLVADNNGEKEEEDNADPKQNESENARGSAITTTVSLEQRKPLILDYSTLHSTKGRTDTVRRSIEDQPLAPGVDTMEDKVMFALNGKSKGPDESKPCNSQVGESKDIIDPGPPGVITPTSPIIVRPSLSVVDADRNISKESQFISVGDSGSTESPEFEEESTERDIETKRSKLEDRVPDENESTAVEDKETEAAPKRITRSRGRARGRGVVRGRSRGRGKRKSTIDKKT